MGTKTEGRKITEGRASFDNARRNLEKKSGRRVPTKENFKEIPEAEKRKQLKVGTRLGD